MLVPEISRSGYRIKKPKSSSIIQVSDVQSPSKWMMSPGSTGTEHLKIKQSVKTQVPILFSFFKYFIDLFSQREGRRKKQREKNMCVREKRWSVAFRTTPQPGIWPATQACAPTGNQTSDLLLCMMMPNLLSHASQGLHFFLFFFYWF